MSNRNSNKHPIEDCHKQPIKNLLNELKADPNAYPFSDPVNWEGISPFCLISSIGPA